MKSTLNNLSNAVLERKVPASEIIKLYNREFNINVNRNFSGVKEVEIYKCTDTGYGFYYPFTTAGDIEFYMRFQKFDWYYMSWKWEHQLCFDYIKPGFNVLEVGCGEGAFLKRITKEFGSNCVALELNESCVLSEPNLEFENTTIEEFSKNNKEKFDVACTFQVLEHVAKVSSFIQSHVDCLKKALYW